MDGFYRRLKHLYALLKPRHLLMRIYECGHVVNLFAEVELDGTFVVMLAAV